MLEGQKYRYAVTRELNKRGLFYRLNTQENISISISENVYIDTGNHADGETYL